MDIYFGGLVESDGDLEAIVGSVEVALLRGEIGCGGGQVWDDDGEDV